MQHFLMKSFSADENVYMQRHKCEFASTSLIFLSQPYRGQSYIPVLISDLNPENEDEL